MIKFLAPTNDVVFKLLFSKADNSDLLISFLTAVLQPKSPIVSTTILNPELPKDTSTDKTIILDVTVQLSDKSLVDVEMQVDNRRNLRKRIPYYLARLHQMQLPVGAEYTAIKPTASIVVLAYNETKEDNFHTIYEMRERSSHLLFSDDLSIHLIELLKVSKYLATHPAEQNQEVIFWTRFFNSTTAEELEALAMERPLFEKANQALKVISSDPVTRQIIDDREKALMSFVTSMEGFREEGIQIGLEKGLEKGMEKGMKRGRQEGIEKGIEQNRKEVVLNLHAEGVNPGQIARILKIDGEIVQKIIEGS